MDVPPLPRDSLPDPRLFAARHHRMAVGIAALGQADVAHHGRVAHDPHVGRGHRRVDRSLRRAQAEVEAMEIEPFRTEFVGRFKEELLRNRKPDPNAGEERS